MFCVSAIYPNHIIITPDNKSNSSQESFDNIVFGSLAFVGKYGKLVKIIRIDNDDNFRIVAQCLDCVSTIRLLDEVHFLDVMQLTQIHPGLLGSCVDFGGGNYDNNGLKVDAQDNKFDFIPVVQNNQDVIIGQKIGYASITPNLKYWLQANTSGKISGVGTGAYSIYQTICAIENSPIMLATFCNTDKLDLQSKNNKLLQTNLPAIDLLYPILIGNQALIHNPPLSLRNAFWNSNSVDIVIVLTNNPIPANKPNIITIVDTYNQPKTTCQFASNIAIQLASMGYNILIWNDLQDCNYTWQHGCGYNETQERLSITVISTESNDDFDQRIVCSGNRINSSLSCYYDSNIESFLLAVGNIQFITDFKEYHRICLDNPDNCNMMFESMLDLNNQSKVDFELLHKLVL